LRLAQLQRKLVTRVEDAWFKSTLTFVQANFQPSKHLYDDDLHIDVSGRADHCSAGHAHFAGISDDDHPLSAPAHRSKNRGLLGFNNGRAVFRVNSAHAHENLVHHHCIERLNRRRANKRKSTRPANAAAGQCRLRPLVRA